VVFGVATCNVLRQRNDVPTAGRCIDRELVGELVGAISATPPNN